MKTPLETYKELKAEADAAWEKWETTQAPMDWGWFLTCEHKAADYAFAHEKEIWPDDS